MLFRSVAKIARALGLATHYGYVKSELNPADAFTRWDLMQEAVHRLQPWVTMPIPPKWKEVAHLAGSYSLDPLGLQTTIDRSEEKCDTT